MAVKTINISCSNSAVGNALEDVGNPIDTKCRGGEMIFQVRNNDNSIALADFSVMVKANADADWVNLVTGAAWGTIAGALKHKAVDIHTLAADSSAVVVVDASLAYQVKFQAKAASGSISVDIIGTCSYN